MFYLIPLVASLALSFTDYDLVDHDDEATQFVGLDNWQPPFEDPDVRHSAWVTLKFAVCSCRCRCSCPSPSPTC